MIKTLKAHKAELKRTFAVKTLGIFGSYARGEQTKKSDLDILAEFDVSPDFFQFVELERHLSDFLGVKVDLVSKKGLKPIVSKQIQKEVVAI